VRIKPATPSFGQRQTHQRTSVLSALGRSTSAQSAEEVFRRLGADKERMSLSTVYRNLNNAYKAGIVSRVRGALDNSYRYFMVSTTDFHAHTMTCRKCRRSFELSTCPLDNALDTLDTKGFSVDGHHLELIGTCRECCSSK
jgi:Fur family ferric uptake transcriptional regulator